MTIDTDQLSARYRIRLIDVNAKRILLSRIGGSDQEADLSEPTNAGGLGRIRHFRRRASEEWVSNPLPLDPACAHLGLSRCDQMTAQVFQNAACNWRCWYCYVPFNLLAAKRSHSELVSVDELVDAYLELPERPKILDLSGGQPELTPEWLLWVMDALEARGLSSSVYLWSDDNLSNDYYWRYLTASERTRIAKYENYGKVACFKGFDTKSFAFNTEAEPTRFDYQFELFRRYLEEGLDIYAYVTLTHSSQAPVHGAMRQFLDRLQAIDVMLPLRTVPLEVIPFGPVVSRLNDTRRRAIEIGQYEALNAWLTEIAARFSTEQLEASIENVAWANH